MTHTKFDDGFSLKATSNGKEEQNYSVSANVTYRHMNLVTVSLPDPPSSRRRKRSTESDIHGWDIQLSYDGSSFGNSTTILLYNSLTESCDATTLICTVKVRQNQISTVKR
jgi:hypothetical protein